MAACWRELAAREKVDLSVIAVRSNRARTEFDYSASVTQGFDCTLITTEETADTKKISSLVNSFGPDIIFLAGWSIPAYAALVYEKRLSGVPKVMTMDTTLKRDWRQFIAPLKIGRYLKRMAAVFVPGERSRQLARYWGVPETKIRMGSYSFDYNLFARAYEARTRLPEWPKAFLFTGQYIERKGIHQLLSAYGRYRKSVDDPWPLTLCGSGPLKNLLQGLPGVKDRGFAQPADMGGVMEKAGVFVHPSLYDAWGVAIAEACAAGLPVLCTAGCAASVELVRDYYNGIALPTGDDLALHNAMVWMHENHASLPQMGANSQSLARPYSAEAWLDRVLSIVEDVCCEPQEDCPASARQGHAPSEIRK
jgi:glycosyltransferase involved in cell wall biosynthesis